LNAADQHLVVITRDLVSLPLTWKMSKNDSPIK
jgi:hypothetical protein